MAELVLDGGNPLFPRRRRASKSQLVTKETQSQTLRKSVSRKNDLIISDTLNKKGEQILMQNYILKEMYIFIGVTEGKSIFMNLISFSMLNTTRSVTRKKVGFFS